MAPLNLGGYYDVTSEIYTLPVDGVYEFILHIRCIDDAGFGAWIDIDNVAVSLMLLFHTFTAWCALTIQQYRFHMKDFYL